MTATGTGGDEKDELDDDACNNPEVPCTLVISSNFLFLVRDDWWDMSFANTVGKQEAPKMMSARVNSLGGIRRIWEPFRIHSWHTAPKTEIFEHKDVVHCWLIEGYRNIHDSKSWTSIEIVLQHPTDLSCKVPLAPRISHPQWVRLNLKLLFQHCRRSMLSRGHF